MIDHISVPVSDLEKSKELYTAMLTPLGYACTADYSEHGVVGFGTGTRANLWIGKSGATGKMHVAFAAGSKGAVEAFHQQALDAGASDNGAPGYRTEYSPGYYAAFVHDLDGNNIEAVFRDPEKS